MNRIGTFTPLALGLASGDSPLIRCAPDGTTGSRYAPPLQLQSEVRTVNKKANGLMWSRGCLATALACSLGSAMAAPPSAVDCIQRSANVAVYDRTNFASMCYARDASGVATQLKIYLAPSLGNLSGSAFDTTYYSVNAGSLSFLGGFAGSVSYDKQLGRSFVQLPFTSASFGPINQALRAWILDPASPTTVLNRFNLRDAKGCLAHSVDYSTVSDFVPPAVGECVNLAP